MRRVSIVVMAMVLIASLVSLQAEERVDQDIYWKIRREGTDHSQILPTMHVLSDVYGPRLTGSPNLKAAGQWAVQQMETWGLKNGHLEPWEFGHPGWSNERLSAHIVSPVKDHLVSEALAWTPGTNGPVRAQATQITLPQRPTKEELTAHLEKLKDAVKGKMVLVGEPRRVLMTFNPPPLRREDSQLVRQFDEAAARRRPPSPPARRPAARDAVLSNRQIDQQLNEFLVASGALVRINDARRDHGQIRAFGNRTYDIAKAVPTVVMRNEDYGRISRLLADARSVELEFDIVNRSYPEGQTNYNAVAEIPGGDRADEVVMLGAHLDSWHAATGATDNAIGSAVVMEAARILAAIGVRPRRTIRFALWTGEEQGLHGSAAYVKEHFGTFEEPKPEFAKFAGYFNLDNGTGRARGMTVFGPPAAATVLREATAPFQDFGVLGAATTQSRRRGGSDHTSFNEAGLPGIRVEQDPIQYNSHTWHTNLDTYERIAEDDAVKAAMVVAAAAYHLAMRDELLPRFSKEEMPKRPQPRRTEPQQTSTPQQ